MDEKQHKGNMPFDYGYLENRDKNTLKGHRKGCNQGIQLSFEEKPFKCNTCSYQCSKKHNMSRHVLLHTRAKPYQCHICEQNFSKKSLLNTHLISIHEVKPFRCDICGQTFSTDCRKPFPTPTTYIFYTQMY